MELPAHAFPSSALRRTRRPRRVAAALVVLALAGALTVFGGASPAGAVSGSMLPGIDVSHHNGTVDWKQVKAAGYKFAFAKATEGTSFVDPEYATNRSGTAAAHLAFGAYHFARPSGSTSSAIAADGKAEADWFLDNARPHAGDLLPVLDLEQSGGLSIPNLQAWAWAFLNEVVARIHEKPIIYSGNYFWATYMGDTTQFADAGFKLLWVPHWTSDPQPRVPGKDWGGNGWTFWQWTSQGTVPGVPTARAVDLDRFNGTDLTGVEMGFPPANAQPPTVSGTAEETATLTAGDGSWNGTSPFDFSYRWVRCDSGGGDCAYVPGADERTYTLTAADIGTTVSVEVTAANALGSATADSGSTQPVEPFDVIPPSVPVFTAPATRYVVSTQVPVAWSSTDNRSGVGSYHVRVRTAAAAGAFAGYRDVFASTPSTQTTLDGQAGHSYCFSAMATDRWNNASAWSGERCTTVPADDRSFTASSGWTGERAPGFFLGTALSSTTRGATLTRAGLNAHRIRLVALTCPSCGRVQLVWNGAVVAAFDLVTRTPLHRHLLPEVVLPALSTGGTLEVRVASAKRPVVIDGVAVTQL